MFHSLIYLLLFLAAALSARGEGSPWLVKTWDTDDGLPQNSVVSLAQTPDGRLWAGTQLGGLASFDGVRFRVYDPSNTEVMDRLEVYRLMVDNGGVLWVSQVGGALLRYADGLFEKVRATDAGDQLRVEELLHSSAGEVTFQLLGDSLLSYTRGGGPREHVLPEARADSSQPAADADGRVFYAVEGDRLGWWEDGDSGVLPVSFGGRVRSLVADRDGGVWVGTLVGVGKLSAVGEMSAVPGEEFRVDQLQLGVDGSLWVRGAGRLRRIAEGAWAAEAKGLPERMVGAQPRDNVKLVPAADGGMWVLNRFAGVWHVAGDGAVTQIGSNDGLPGGLVECGLVDREGSLWLGFSGGGLAQVRRSFLSVMAPAGGAAPVVKSICEGPDGSLWMGHADGSLVQWVDGERIVWPLPDDTSARELSVWTDADGVLWVGSVGGGVWHMREGELRRPFPPSAMNTVVRTGMCDRSGRVWMGSESGLFCWENGELRGYSEEDGFSGKYVMAIAEDPAGALWIGTAEGSLWRFLDGGFDSWSREGEPEFRFWSLYPAGDGSVWVGTLAGGLLRWRDGELRRATHVEGLPSDTITQILTDTQGQLWCGSRNGLFSMPLRELGEFFDGGGGVIETRLFTLSDGLPAMEFSGGSYPGCVVARDGRLWFATVKGAVGVDPDAIPYNPLPPGVLIEEVNINGVGLDFSNELALDPGRHSCEFRFTATSLVAPEKVRFQWHLEGLEEEWVDGGTARSVRYSFLQPGRYVFQVRACNNDGVWNTEGARVVLSVAPYFWQRLWFRIAMPLLALGVVAAVLSAVLRSRHRREVERLARRQALLDERARIARDLHDDLGASLTQLTWLCEGAGSAENSATDLADIGAKSRGMVRSIDAIVWAVDPRNDTLDGLVHYICQFAEDFLRGTGIRCRLDVDDHLPAHTLGSVARHNAFLIAREAIHNAARHSGASEVNISIHASENEVTISIADNGIGFDTSGSSNGSGLRNMRARAKALGTGLHLSAGEGAGCEVQVKLSLG